MNIAIIGLGLIGGSLAKAFVRAGHTVYASDINNAVEDAAIMHGACHGKCDGHIGECDMVFVALYPEATVEYIADHSAEFKKGSIVVDTCGVKQSVCDKCFETAQKNGFHFIGGHPMAGKQFSGFKYSDADLFDGATMIIVPKHYEDMAIIGKLHDVLKEIGFKSVTTTTAVEHDRMIAFTSQLAHIVSNAYVKSPTAEKHHNFSAGSYRDLTRVAKLNENMWSELFDLNRDALVFELDSIIKSLTEYKDAIAAGNRSAVCELLRDGRLKKEAIDTEWQERN
ncbi:MAG: prephenate dehydrogenase [Ruminococcaceae bacterium]|nr:prephenate dehydrogenase [Oscillospiraceae bacterium]